MFTPSLWFLSIALFLILVQAVDYEARLEGVRATKSIPVVLDGWVLTRLTIKNNTTRPIFDVEVHEYLHPSLRVGGNLSIIYKGMAVQLDIIAPENDLIIVPLRAYTLAPGEELCIEYWSSAPSSGDYLIPSSLIWYSQMHGEVFLRRSAYSNSLNIHLPTALERGLAQIFPYLVPAISLVIILTVLINLRSAKKGGRAQAFQLCLGYSEDRFYGDTSIDYPVRDQTCYVAGLS